MFHLEPPGIWRIIEGMAHIIGKCVLSYGGVTIGEVQAVAEFHAADGQVWTKWDTVTDAARLIAALHPIRFPANRAGQLGNRCVRELLSRFPAKAPA